ncbi:MAG: LLM class flavin-dependent oxidoreductase [Egibacteraceae bacterium]
MKLGTFLLAAQFPGLSQAQALSAAAEYTLATEHAGFHSAWIAEHHFISYGVCPSATIFAAHALGRTRRIEVGTAVAILSNRHPVALAEETALLDHISGGRFHLGVGRGGPWIDLEVFGTGLARYERGFAEALDLLLRWLTSERVTVTGEFFAFREVGVVPRSATQPRPPVTVAATSPATAELAAIRGLPLLLGMHMDDQEKAAMLASYAQVAARHGHDPTGVPHVAAVLAYVNDSRTAALADLRAGLPRWLERGVGEYISLASGGRRRRDLRAYAERLLSIHPIGTAEECAERLAAAAERTGIRHFLLMVEGAGTRSRTLDNITRLGAQVLPRLDLEPTPTATDH